MKDFSSEELTENLEAWRTWGIRDMQAWVTHLDVRRESRALEEGDTRQLENELLYGVFSLLNRLAQVHYCSPKHLGTRDRIVPWLGMAANMTSDVAMVFWNSVRNPVLHMGSWFSLTPYTLLGEFPAYATVRLTKPEGLAEAEPPESEAHLSMFTGEFNYFLRALGWSIYGPVEFGESDVRRSLLESDSKEFFDVEFYLDELLLLLRHAISVTSHALDGPHNRAQMIGLQQLSMRIAFGVSSEEAESMYQRVQENRAAAGLPPLDDR